MQIIDFKELISFIEDSPEKSIPKSILIEEINTMKKEAENQILKAEKRINISLVATGLYVLSKTTFILYDIFQNIKPILMNLYIMDAIIPAFLCVGIFYKKKVASLSILIYYLISSYIHLEIQGINIVRFLLVFIYSYIYIQGYFANLSYHKHSAF
ncbi:MAG: hypothetical protein PHF25_06485 [Candidatus Margulisbacteria bacterium]|nr:hypothetical protein [Candidatus Margulisiibacteriota bacterium]